MRTVGAVGGIADKGIFVWLTRGRLWIGLLGALLVGIVALNVMALSFSASSSSAGQQADELKRQNSALRTELASKLSSQQVQASAAKLGLVFAPPGSIRYLSTSPGDAAKAAERIRSGDLDPSTYVPPAAVETATVPPVDAATVAPTEADAAVATDPATATAPVEPEVAPTETAPTEVAPTEAATTAPPATSVDGGGVGAP
jgi:hypothetical protein